MKNLWALHDQQDRRPRVAVTPPAIIGAAIAIADTDGIEAVSMQRIANRVWWVQRFARRCAANCPLGLTSCCEKGA